MNFKDSLKEDIQVFLNQGEFAETHRIDATSCTAIVQDVVINDSLYPKYGADAFRDGIYAYGCIINVRKDDLPKVPVMGTVLKLDGRIGRVVNIADDEGILTITWSANEI